MSEAVGEEPRNATLSDADIRTQVRALVSQNRIQWRAHAELQMAKRNIAKSEVKQCLRAGYFSERPFFPARRGPLQYEFCMRATVDGRTIEVPAALIPDQNVVVITAKLPRR
jgi:hypothetical protein